MAEWAMEGGGRSREGDRRAGAGGDALTENGNWVVGPDRGLTPPTSPLVLSSIGGERETQVYANYFL